MRKSSIPTLTLAAFGGLLFGALGQPALRRFWDARSARIVADMGTPGHRLVLWSGRRADLEQMRKRISPAFGRVWIESGPRQSSGG